MDEDEKNRRRNTSSMVYKEHKVGNILILFTVRLILKLSGIIWYLPSVLLIASVELPAVTRQPLYYGGSVTGHLILYHQEFFPLCAVCVVGHRSLNSASKILYLSTLIFN